MEATPLPPSERTDVKALGRDELEAFAVRLGEPAYRGRQLFTWLYDKGAASFDEMTSLPKRLRARLEATAVVGGIEEVARQQARDGTVKLLFALSSGRRVETVLIPDFDGDGSARRLTVCVSSQVGCAMGCTFCATGLLGFQQNLTGGEIADQVRHADALARAQFGRGVTNVVYMGMGEPLLNYAHVLRSVEALTHPDGMRMAARRITVSTVGLARRIRQLADDGTRFNLAVSLHAPTDAQRSAIMPVNRTAATDLTALREAIRYYTAETGRQVTYEYCMFAGTNDRPEDARHLADFVRQAPGKVNLIMYNPVEGLGFHRTPEADLERFIRVLVDRGVTVTVRRSRGQDIDAACGQLAGRDGGLTG